jgi:hypothetical protein
VTGTPVNFGGMTGRALAVILKLIFWKSCDHKKVHTVLYILFTREYTKCTAGSTFCFVVVLVVVRKPLIKLAGISADS